MENGNDQDDDPKKNEKQSHKMEKPTIRQLAKVKRDEEKAQKAAPKSRNRLPKHNCASLKDAHHANDSKVKSMHCCRLEMTRCCSLQDTG
jgi:hypothetical protein